jgi:hypothetical protein
MTTSIEKPRKKKHKLQWADLSWTAGMPLVLAAEPPVPLALGIYADIIPLLTSKDDSKRLKAMLGYHVDSIGYLKAATAAGARHNNSAVSIHAPTRGATIYAVSPCPAQA